MCFRRRMCGLLLFVFSAGIFVGILLSGSALILGAILIVAGFWLLFM